MAASAFRSPSYASHSSGGGGSPFAFVSHLVHDIGDAARGTPEGLLQLAEHPIRTAENMGKMEWQQWSPLFKGHVGEFGHQFYQHPLAPMLDILTVFTGGASLAGKMGMLGEIPRTLEIMAPEDRAALAKGAPHALSRTYTKLLPRNPIYNKMYRSTLKAADSHGIVPNWFGSAGVYKRLEFSDWANSKLALSASIAAMMKAGETFDKAGHTEWKTLEEQMFQASHKDILANSHELPLQELVDKYHGNLPEGYAPVKPELNFARPLYGKWAKNPEDFANHVKLLGKKFLGKRDEWNKYVHENANGELVVKIAHKRAFEKTTLDGSRSVTTLHNLYRYPTAIWKYVMVGISPRTVVDNTVGNWLMYVMRQGGAHGLHGFVEAVRYSRGEPKALQVLAETRRLPESVSYFRHFKGELQNVYGKSALGVTGIGETGVRENENLLSKAYRYSLYPYVHKYADVPVRAASISAFLKGHPVVRSLEKQGMSFREAADYALTHHPTLRDETIQHARTVAGNYLTLSKTEHVLRDTIPFYLWDKHIAMHAANMLRDRPAVVAAGSALGQTGANETRKQLGDIPDWMIGAIAFPFGQPGSDKGRTQLLNTTGLNPYSTVPDLVGAAQALTVGHTDEKPGEAILGMTNPVISGFIQQAMGQKTSGAPVTAHGGVIPSILTDTVNSLRPIQLIRELAGAGSPDTTRSGKSRLYKSDFHSIISTMAGFPLQQADLEHAAELQARIKNHGKAPKKKRGSAFRAP